jgi:hypothetical protein
MATRHASASVIADLARQKQEGQLQAIDSLDAKASTLIGFSGVVLGLIFTSPAVDHWNWGLTVGVGGILLAIFALGVVLLPRRYARNPNVLALRSRYLDSDPASTNLAIIDSIQVALAYNADVTKWKVFALRVGTILAIVGILVMSVSLVYSVTTNQPATSHQERRPK